MARNGPISLPLGLSTPMMAAPSSSQKLSSTAMPAPPNTMSPAPSSNIRRRPRRSARVVMVSEIAASPSSVNASNTPTRASA